MIASRENVIYARVSSAKQKADLVRQVDFLRHRFPNHKVVTDVGSGVNFKRKGTQPFDASSAGLVGEIVVAHRDRLARIGYGLLEHVFLRQDQFSLSSKIMLATDVQKNSTKTSWRCLPISQPNNGKRSYANRKVARSLKIRIRTRSRKELLKQYGRRDTFTPSEGTG
jgi:hypothetical protein